MKSKDAVDALCVEVFSKISAAVSHEIKNTLSIINENAGLLNDLAIMAGEDGGVPSGQVNSTTATIAKQVSRSNTIMQNLNRFAHSGDTPVSQANLQEILQLMIALTSRQAASKSVTVSIHCPDDITITTCLLPLEVLLFFILDNLYNIADPGAALLIHGSVTGPETEVIFTEGSQQSGKFGQYNPGEEEQVLAQVLKGTCKKSSDSIIITFASDKGIN